MTTIYRVKPGTSIVMSLREGDRLDLTPPIVLADGVRVESVRIPHTGLYNVSFQSTPTARFEMTDTREPRTE